jgi:hypothetical protein
MKLNAYDCYFLLEIENFLELRMGEHADMKRFGTERCA